MTRRHTSPPAEDYLDVLSNFLANTHYEDLPQVVREHAKYVWMDTVGVILAGSLEPQAEALAGRLADAGGTATVLRPGFPLSPPMSAAFVNGTAGTFLELDEGCRPRGHPAIYIVPAVLALGEATGAGGKKLIEALVLAYDVAARLSWASQFVRGMHTHGSLGVMAAAVGAACVLGYDTLRIREVINMAACLNGATPLLANFEGALVRNAYAGFSAHMGVIISHLCDSGFNGPRSGLSEAYTSVVASALDPEKMTAGLGDEYHIVTSNYFKLHASCRGTHAPLDALERALAGRAVLPKDIREVVVTTNGRALMFGRRDPQNSLAAKFSIPFAVATRIVRQNAGVAAFRQDAVDDPIAQDLARRVKLVEDPVFTSQWPQRESARVEIVQVSGERWAGMVENPKGDPPSPVSYAEVERKFLALTSTIFTGKRNALAMEVFTRLEKVPRATEVTSALRDLSQ